MEQENNNRSMQPKNIISRWTEVLLRLFGIWPEASCVSLLRLFWSVTIVTEQIFQFRHIAVNINYLQFYEVMNILSIIMTHLLLLLKVAIFWYKQRTFIKILTMMGDDWKTCSTTEFNMCTVTYKLSERFVNLVLVLHSIAVVLFSCSIFVTNTGEDRNSNISVRPFIVNLELPFEITTFVYGLIIIIQFFHLLSCSYAVGILNALLITLILHVGNQMDILCKWLMDVFSEKKKHDLSSVTIKEVIRKHQRIILFSEYIEDLYSDIAILLFVSDTLTICCLGFILVTSVGASNGVKIIMNTLFFYLIIIMEAFVFCAGGEYLSNKSKNIGDAAYDSLWYKSGSKDDIQDVLFLIMRSQNQLSITIGKVTNLSLERFSTIIKASASYISVLLAIS